MILEDILIKLKQEKNSIAYTENNKSYTYAELYKFISNVYKYLLQNNTEKKPVIVYGHKEIYMKATFLACSFAGMTYVPVDNSVPKERVNLIIEQVKPYCVVGDFVNTDTIKISTKQIYEIMQKEDLLEIDKIYMQPEGIYYIIFTSGSTGVPKGVKITYKNLDSCVRWLQNITKIQKRCNIESSNFFI